MLEWTPFKTIHWGRGQVSRHLDDVRVRLQEALRLAPSDYQRALEDLDNVLLEARASGNTKTITLLARNAGLIASRAGELQKATVYYEEAIASDPRDGYLRLAAADVYQHLEDAEGVRRHLEACQELVEKSEDDDLRIMLRNLMDDH